VVLLMVGRSVYREQQPDISPKENDSDARVAVLLEICRSRTLPIPQKGEAQAMMPGSVHSEEVHVTQ